MIDQQNGRAKRVRKLTERAQESAAQAAELEHISPKRRRTASPAVTAPSHADAPAKVPVSKRKTSGTPARAKRPAAPHTAADRKERLHKVRRTVEDLKDLRKSLQHMQGESRECTATTLAAPERCAEQPDHSRASETTGQAPGLRSTSPASSPGTPPVDSEADLRVSASDSGSDHNNSALKGTTRVASAAATAMTALKAKLAPPPVANRRRRKPRTVIRAPMM